jgi:hypothetical protein
VSHATKLGVDTSPVCRHLLDAMKTKTKTKAGSYPWVD